MLCGWFNCGWSGWTALHLPGQNTGNANPLAMCSALENPSSEESAPQPRACSTIVRYRLCKWAGNPWHWLRVSYREHTRVHPSLYKNASFSIYACNSVLRHITSHAYGIKFPFIHLFTEDIEPDNVINSRYKHGKEYGPCLLGILRRRRRDRARNWFWLYGKPSWRRFEAWPFALSSSEPAESHRRETHSNRWCYLW